MSEFEVPQPIICSPFAEPSEHWSLREGTEPARLDGRRPSYYFYRQPRQDSVGAVRELLDTLSRSPAEA